MDAEKALLDCQARRRDWSCKMFEVYGRPLDKHVQAVRDAECAMEAAIYSLARAAFEDCIASLRAWSEPQAAAVLEQNPPKWLTETSR